MRLINRIICFQLRSVRTKRQGRAEEDFQPSTTDFEKIKFTEEELTEMGQYQRDPKARHYKDIFR